MKVPLHIVLARRERLAQIIEQHRYLPVKELCRRLEVSEATLRRDLAALVQANTGSKHPVMLHYDTKSGHAGGKPVNKTIEDATDMLAYLFGQLGITVQ